MLRAITAVVLSLWATNALAQTPQPFPRPNTQKPAQPPTTPAKPQAPPPAPAPSTQAPRTQAPQAPGTQAPGAGAPTEEMLGAPIYPSAVYLTSYDAGRGQRFYIYGSTVPYADLVAFYRTVLKQKGDELYEAPPTHQFETARFRDESMAFPPSVTIKDYTFGGSAGYP
ncbi:MAG TPA: hypothetical protein VFZ31_09070, partial [Vicinamibacterales bacterium]